jgi:hypothetical protein
MEIDQGIVPALPELAGRYLGTEDASAFLQSVTRSVHLRVGGAADPAGTGSRLGGQPMVPAGFSWPTIGPDTWFEPRADEGAPLRFLGQVNTAEVNPQLVRPVLPADTVLTLFFESFPGGALLNWTDPWELAAHRIAAVRVREAVAVRDAGPAPPTAHALEPTAVTTVPPVEYWLRLGTARRDAIEALYAELRPVPPSHPVRMFGWFDGPPRNWNWATSLDACLLLQVTLDPALELGWPGIEGLYAFVGADSLAAGPPYRTSGRYA